MSRDRAASRLRDTGRGRDLLAWLILALVALAILWPLGLTNRILAGVDALTYFTPYWSYRMEALRGGHLPLWNPYLFLGAPFLANPQAAVLYPLHWPLSWLRAEQALVWSAILHAWLAAGFTYTFGRRSLRLSRPAAVLAGLIFGLGGFTLGRVENINQLNALAWLPALLWLCDETARASAWRSRVRWGAGLTVVLALQLLAGHTQTTFVNLAGLGLWAVRPVVASLFERARARRTRPASTAGSPLAALWPLLLILPALLLSAAQLLPTLELNGLSLRTGGLPYRQAVSFSLRPWLLAQSLLPPFGSGLATAFGSEGYAEFVGYVGVAALVLAAAGVRRRWKPEAENRDLKAGPLVLAATGFLLALGAYNPAYYLLWRFVPGFDLFRAPVRWLEMFALGAAALAGLGLDAAIAPPPLGRRGRGDAETQCDLPALEAGTDFKNQRSSAKTQRRKDLLGKLRLRALAPWRFNRSSAFRLLWITGVTAAAILVLIQQPPRWWTLAGWALAGLAAAVLLRVAPHSPRAGQVGLIALTFAELWLGARGLPFTAATAPSATSLRNAPAALLAAAQDGAAAAQVARTDRFLSLSDIRFDPGDLAELRANQADRLPAAAVERLVRAAKQVEVIAPNLSLLYRLPAVDGYDGGLLPLGRYVQLQGLFLPPELLVPDGRLREQLRGVPDGRLLDLTGVRYVLTDKQRDLWAKDVYYDLEMPARLVAGKALTLDLTRYPPFTATALGLVAEAAASPSGSTLLELRVEGSAAATALHLLAGTETQETPRPVRLHLPQPMTLDRIILRVPDGSRPVTLHGLSLIDERTGAHSSVTVSPEGDLRRIHSGDVKLYERIAAPGQAWLVHGIRPAADDATALAILGDAAFNPRAAATITASNAAPSPDAAAGAGEAVQIVRYEAERVALVARVTQPGLLVLADAFYPGWEATIDGQPAPILQVNLMFRGVALAPGAHEITFTYRPALWHAGVWISLATLALLTAAVTVTLPRKRTI